MSDWELAELQHQRELSARLAREGLPMATIVARVRSVGGEVSCDRVRKWVRGAVA